jgi:hypothetical protein
MRDPLTGYPDAPYLSKTTEPMGEHFTFVLTEAGGTRVFGFCRRCVEALHSSETVPVTLL